MLYMSKRLRMIHFAVKKSGGWPCQPQLRCIHDHGCSANPWAKSMYVFVVPHWFFEEKTLWKEPSHRVRKRPFESIGGLKSVERMFFESGDKLSTHSSDCSQIFFGCLAGNPPLNSGWWFNIIPDASVAFKPLRFRIVVKNNLTMSRSLGKRTNDLKKKHYNLRFTLLAWFSFARVRISEDFVWNILEAIIYFACMVVQVSVEIRWTFDHQNGKSLGSYDM